MGHRNNKETSDWKNLRHINLTNLDKISEIWKMINKEYPSVKLYSKKNNLRFIFIHFLVNCIPKPQIIQHNSL